MKPRAYKSNGVWYLVYEDTTGTSHTTDCGSLDDCLWILSIAYMVGRVAKFT